MVAVGLSALLSVFCGTPESNPQTAAPKVQAPKDFDQDGIPDLEDDCPTDPGHKSHGGCPGAPKPAAPKTEVPKPVVPQIRVKGDRLEIPDQIRFQTGSARIVPSSVPLVKAVAAAIQKLPPNARVSVEGHTDNRGSARTNTKLSKRRAAGVVAQLVRFGIPRARLQSQGHGPSQPIANNRTRAGRAENRRVEFVILLSKEKS